MIYVHNDHTVIDQQEMHQYRPKKWSDQGCSVNDVPSAEDMHCAPVPLFFSRDASL